METAHDPDLVGVLGCGQAPELDCPQAPTSSSPVWGLTTRPRKCLTFQSPSMDLEHRVDPKGSYLAQVWNPSRHPARRPRTGPGGG